MYFSAYIREKLLPIFMFFAMLSGGTSSGEIISSEDFEGGASGWNINTTVFHPNFSEFLGQFNPQTVTKVFNTPNEHTEVTIQFDFYRIDSWDGERFRLWVDDVLWINDAFAHNFPSNPPLAVALTPRTNLGFDFWSDQQFRYTLTVPHTAKTVELRFFATLNQSTFDENWGIDNVIIRDNFLLGDVNCDQSVNLLDVDPFVAILTSGDYSAKADINADGIIDLLDVEPFVDILAGP